MRYTIVLALTLSLVTMSAVGFDHVVVEVGSPAPDLELSAADGSSRSLAAADQTMVLIFYRGLW